MSQGRDDETSVEGGAAIARSSVVADEESSGPLPAGTVLAGRYEVRKLIGRGGTGIVVEAWDGTLGVSVAIKVVRAEYTGQRQWTERLAREVKLARKIQHPNVCRVFDFAQADGRAFLIMELAAGGTLRSQISAEAARARSLAERLADARAIAAGVAAIHAAGIVHRDISPQNALRMSDGRLVVSDFGLATDTLGGTTSIHGGTVAYMAPEVLRGGRANFASDVWSLGAVIHEVVFGEPLRWDPKLGETRSAVGGRSLSRAEGSVLEICRACTALNPARRPRDAAEIAARLSGAGLARVAWRRRGRRAIGMATAGLVIVAALAGARRIQSARRRLTEAGPTNDPLMIVPTGEPADWSEKAKVLTEVYGKVTCTVILPDRRTARFVWGFPSRAEDVDTHTGERRLSPLVPDAYAEGCPDLSRDGKRLVYAGHTVDDRAFAFVSSQTDGRDAVPEVQIGEPGSGSDPLWLADGETFVYDVDDKHVATFSMVTKRSLVMPTATAPLYTSFHHVVENRVFVTSMMPGVSGTDVSGFEYPQLKPIGHWRVPFSALDLGSADGINYYCSVRGDHQPLVLTQVEPAMHRARFLGAIPGGFIRHPIFVEDGLAFWNFNVTSTLVLRASPEEPRRVPASEGLMSASACGPRILGTQRAGGIIRTVWINRKGEVVGDVAGSENTGFAHCSSDGKVIFRMAFGERLGIERCIGDSCRMIVAGMGEGSLALSTDDKRLAFVSSDNGGRVVRWVSSDGVGGIHDIVDSGTGCEPIWSSDKLLWVSLRRGRQLSWTEIDTDSGRPTGRTFPGHRDCTDGVEDPQRPLHNPVEIEMNARYQLRLLPAKYLPAD